MTRRRIVQGRRFGWIAVQLLVAVVLAVSYARSTTAVGGPSSETAADHWQPITVNRNSPLVVRPLYDDPTVISDADLAAVLRRVLPRFAPEQLKPNFVEHALRTWGIEMTFADPRVMSGASMRDFLLDHRRFAASWNGTVPPLLERSAHGLSIRWDARPGGSVHHDHLLACLTEAGIHLNEPVFPPAHRGQADGKNPAVLEGFTFNDLIQQALADFRLDQRETEWSAMAFSLWLAPQANSWISDNRRRQSFDLMAQKLIRGREQLGVCSGTHRVYSLVLLLRLDDEYHILSAPVRDEVRRQLRLVRDQIVVSQFPDGHWPGNWPDGADAVAHPAKEAPYKSIIATGHHLEWLAIAPREFQPPRETIRRAAHWLVNSTKHCSPETMRKQYTFYSHVARALALWRGTFPADFWRTWRTKHPGTPAGI